jgi:hypothetical protein
MVKYIVLSCLIIIGYNFVPVQLSTGNVGGVKYENV